LAQNQKEVRYFFKEPLPLLLPVMPIMIHHYCSMTSDKQKLLKYSRELRSSMTGSEIILWRYLRRKQILDLKFNRQKPLGNYIADFYADKIRLIIEIDGAQHFSDDGILYDRKRDKDIENLNIKVLRFTNMDIFKNLNAVLEEIYRNCEERLSLN